MKLIIDISEEAYNGIKIGMRNRDDMREVGEAIENGIPLDNLRAEIEQIPLSEPIMSTDGLYCYGAKSISIGHFREKVFEIIDKYRAESEDKE